MPNQQETLSDLYEQTVAANTIVLASIGKLVKELRAKAMALEGAFDEIARLKKEIENHDAVR